MEPEKAFDKILRDNDRVGGIYLADNSDPNIEIYNWLQVNVNSFFNSGLVNFKNKKPHFYFIQSYEITGCYDYDDEYCYIGLTKGVVNYSSFFFKNIFKDKDFLSDIIEEENQDDQPIIIAHVQFKSWITFLGENPLTEDLYFNRPKNLSRSDLADTFSQYFLLFVFMHEVGHLNQNREKLSELMSQCSNEEDQNIIKQIKEMDADKYAANRLLNHFFNIFHGKEHPINRANSFFYKNEKHLVRYGLLVIFTMFYMYSHNRNFEGGSLKGSHPHPSLRLKYVSDLILNNSVGNNLLGIDNWQNCIKKSLQDFRSIIKKVFPDGGIDRFYSSIKGEELSGHYNFLLKEARKYKGLLNGNYEEIPDSFFN